MPATLKGVGGKAIKLGAPCLLRGPGPFLAEGNLKSINDEGDGGTFKPAKAMFPGATTQELAVKAGELIPWTPPES